MIRNECFDFFGHQTLQVGHDLFAIKEDGLVVTRYHGGADIVREQRAGFGLFRRYQSSAVNYRNKFLYIIGGNDEWKATKTCLVYDIAADYWGPGPEMR